VKHNGIRETLTELRSNYWIQKGRQAVKVLLSRCVACKRLLGKPYGKQPTPPLPDFRVSDDPDFSKIGIDFAGPLYVKDMYRRVEMNKCYIAVFTCASTRAIHLELVPDLTADSFIRAFKTFIGRRGVPSCVVSDNGKTFHDAKVKKFSSQRNIAWKVNAPIASWWGGFFEICVKLVKRSLKKVTGNAKLSYEELETTLIEIEGVLNSRPLTCVYDEITEQPITPSCFLMSQPSLCKLDNKKNEGTLSKRARYWEKLLDHFRRRWKMEYLYWNSATSEVKN
jgi:transposase InsO family protein